MLMELRSSISMEVISADSRQIYRGMDIGTAKPSMEERELLPHHLLDLMDPDGDYSAGRFASDSEGLVPEIRSRGALPVVAGGTGLYVLALTGALDPLPSADSGLREALSAMEDGSPGTLLRMLCELDPGRAEELGPADTVRQLRAVEICFLTGKRPSDLLTGGAGSTEGREYSVAAIHVERDVLRERIQRRTQGRLRHGLIDEVRNLRAAGWGRESALGRTIGYRETLDYLDGRIGSTEDLGEAISANTWRLSRKQTNMYRRITGIRWITEVRELSRFLHSEGEQ